jgi:hypothetical protein
MEHQCRELHEENKRFQLALFAIKINKDTSLHTLTSPKHSEIELDNSKNFIRPRVTGPVKPFPKNESLVSTKARRIRDGPSLILSKVLQIIQAAGDSK